MKPVVAVIGRPNVGKSSLVNRILGRRDAIVEEKPGVTRDRVHYDASWQGSEFMLVDTGGLEFGPTDELAGKVGEVAYNAASTADVILFVCDATRPLTREDRDVADRLRRFASRVIVVANKIDAATHEDLAWELAELGLGNPVSVSALHGRGSGDLLDLVVERFPEDIEIPERPDLPRICIVGRPNVGKSSIFNAISNDARSIVHDMPGTTRDAVDSEVEIRGERVIFVDTAGLRHRPRIDESTEWYGLVRTMRAIDESDLAVLVVDDAEGISRQDLRIVDRILEAGCSCVIALNKIDLVEPEVRKVEIAEVRRRLPGLWHAPLVETSAVSGKGIKNLCESVLRVLAQRDFRFATSDLNNLLLDVQARTPIPAKKAGARVKYAAQVASSPPTIRLFGVGEKIPERWLRHLDKQIRRVYPFEGTPIRFLTGSGRKR